MRLKIRRITRRTSRQIEEGFNPISFDYIFEEDDPLSPWLEEREAPVLDGQDNSWMNIDEDDSGFQAPPESENIQSSSSHSDGDQNPSNDSDDDDNDGGGSGDGVGAQARLEDIFEELPSSPFYGDVGLCGVSGLHEVGNHPTIPRRRRSSGQGRGVESQRGARLSRSYSLNSASDNMQQNFGRLGVGESSSSFDSQGHDYPPPPSHRGYPPPSSHHGYPPPPPHYYQPPQPSYYPHPPQYYPPPQPYPSHFTSSSSSSHHPDQQEDSSGHVERTFDNLFGEYHRGGSSQQSRSDRSDDYVQPARHSTSWW